MNPLPAACLALILSSLPCALTAAEIHRAANAGDLAKVQSLAAADPESVNGKDESGHTPLWQAVQRNRTEVVRFLLEQKADPRTSDANGTTILHLAANAGRKEIVELLLQKGVPVDLPDAEKQTPLHLASLSNRLEVATLLLDRGAKTEASTSLGFTALHYAAWNTSPRLLELLLARGANPNATANDGTTPLLIVSGNGRADAVKALLAKGADAGAQNAFRETPLHLAARMGSVETVEALLGAAGKIDAAEAHNGQTALHWAAIFGHARVAALILKAGASNSAKDANGLTALDCAVRYGNGGIASALADGATAKRSPAANASPAEPVANDKAIVWYCGHSGWVVKTGRRLLVFDYWKPLQTTPATPGLQNGFINPAELRDLEITVFVSHNHDDHFDKRIFAWKEAGLKINYVYGFKFSEKARRKYTGPDFTEVGPQEQKEIAGMKVTGIKSTDAGGGFLVQVNGLTLFHAGDHANLNAGTREAYDREITALANVADHVDIAFLPVSGCPSGWQHDHVVAGFFSAVATLKARTVFPMHGYNREWEYREFSLLGRTRSPDASIRCAQFPGDSFKIE